MVFHVLNHHIKSLQINILFASMLLRPATCNCGPQYRLLFRIAAAKFQAAKFRALIAVAAIERYRYCGRNCGRYHRYLLPWLYVVLGCKIVTTCAKNLKRAQIRAFYFPIALVIHLGATRTTPPQGGLCGVAVGAHSNDTHSMLLMLE